MRCPVCNAEWQMPVNSVAVRSNCPFCGADLVKVNVSSPMESVLSAIYQQIGETGMRNGPLLVSWFKDLAPALQKEARTLSVFVKYSGHVELLKAKNSSDNNIITVAKRIVSQMKDDPFPEEYACMACEAFCKAIGIRTSLSSLQKEQPPSDKKNGILAWLVFAGLVAVVLFGILFFFREKTVGIDDKNGALDSSDKTRQGSGYDAAAETKKPQAKWAEWTDELPAYVTSANYIIEERTIYRSRHLEKTSSTQGDTMDGWELYDSAVGNGDYGAWSAWQEETVSKTDSREVETQYRYRYRDKETTTNSSSTLQGWTLDDTTYSWGDYGSWSQWNTDKVSPSDSREVETKTQYRYRDKETTTSSDSSLSGWTQYDSSTSWGDYGSWSSWSTDSVSQNDGRQVEQKTQYRYRDKTFTTSENSSLNGWTCYNTSTSYGDWSNWSDAYVAATDYLQVRTQTVVDVPEHTEYRYGAYYGSGGTWCCRYDTQAHLSYTELYTSWSQTRVSPLELRATCGYYHTSTHPHDHYAGHFNTGGYNHGSYKDFWYQYVINGTTYYWEESKVVPATYKTQYQYRNIYRTYFYWKWGSWSDYSDNKPSGNDNRQIESRTVYRSRTRSRTTTYYYYRWKGWSSWSSTEVSESGNREVQTGTFYRYRDRTSIPTYHFSRWKEWSSWSESAVTQSSNREVESKAFYRYRERVEETTYYFRRWSVWSDYSETPVEETGTVEVETKVQYRYISK